MSDTWDLVVVGAGPAGASAALAALHADPALKVLLLDRSDFPRDKSCGDGIAPHCLDKLASIGVTGVEEGWAPLTQLELARSEQAVARPMARPVYVIPRQVFDARLVERAVDRGAELRREKLVSLETVSSRTDSNGTVPDRTVSYENNSYETVLNGTIRGRIVVGADGAHSVVRSELGLPYGRRAIAIRGYAATPAVRRGTQVIRYGDRRQPAYAWAFDRGDGLSNIGYGELLPTDGEPPPSRALLLDQLEQLLPGYDGTEWKGHHLPLSGWRWQQPDGGLLLAGDAAGLINPMTGEGIYYAIATGIAAGRSAVRALRGGGDAGALHRQAVRAEFGRHLKHTWVASRLAEHSMIVDGGIRVARRDRRVFDELVELGLGDGRISGRLVRGLVGGLGRRAVSTTSGRGR
ncbi:MAG TPA: NAD(P)/FAD-dependent oxidoreductase [Nocardioides sp.]|uniref:NAD(P)/FAD-dependent oxidoreductase n=1 Tax=Nocardioides sp. TaxID=35761 RepID=UPI002E3156B9|nr:NAD(P)/FAD-dependent oxidoreductase [Nocardioides sp.]HEX5090951.1 NAD(P)/FAD-dependent oxidoreductase [Nocardioides sp.]